MISSKTMEQVRDVLLQLGYSEVLDKDKFERRIFDWQNKKIISQFDSRQGLGKGKGTAKREWTDGAMIINQLICITKLSKRYRLTEAWLIPLHMHGFKTPPFDLILSSLKKPLDLTSSAIENELNRESTKSPQDCIGQRHELLEEIIDEATSQKPMGEIPQTVNAATWNLIVNPSYNFKEESFNEAVSDLYNFSIQRPDKYTTKNLKRIASIFTRFFSVYRLSCAIDKLTEENKNAVEYDFNLFCLAAQTLYQRIKNSSLRDYVSGNQDEYTNSYWEAMYSLAKLFILFDVSIRNYRFGKLVDHQVRDILQSIPKYLHDENLQLIAKTADDVYNHMNKKSTSI